MEGEIQLEDLPRHRRRDSAFLTPERVSRCGAIAGRLLFSEHSWVERRKESIEILDDTAIRRHTTVDFSFRSSSMCRLVDSGQVGGRDIFCAPVFVLKKAPSRLMDFDLVDEVGKRHRLQSRVDNMNVSAGALIKGAEILLRGRGLSAPLRTELHALATGDTRRGEAINNLLRSRYDDGDEELATLFEDGRFRFWLSLFALNSIAVVLYSSETSGRKLFKLSYTERLVAANERNLAKLGWTPYRLVLNLPLVEARSFHFEATSPPGLRISETALKGREGPAAVRVAGDNRREHIYLPDATSATDGLVTMRLSPGKPGFILGAFVASLSTAVALAAIHNFKEEIVQSASSAPAILLVLPGIIATYVGRPVSHAMTTRLLSRTRWLLVASGVLAYLGAATIVIVGSVAGATPEEIQDLTREKAGELGPPTLILSVLAGLVALSIGYTAFLADGISRFFVWWSSEKSERDVKPALVLEEVVEVSVEAFREVLKGETPKIYGWSCEGETSVFEISKVDTLTVTVVTLELSTVGRFTTMRATIYSEAKWKTHVSLPRWWKTRVEQVMARQLLKLKRDLEAAATRGGTEAEAA